MVSICVFINPINVTFFVHIVCILEKAMASHSSTLAWEVPWMEEPGRLQSMGSRRVWRDWVTSLPLFTFMHWRRKWQPTPVFLPGESQGRGSLVGCCLGSHRVGHDWSDLAASVCILLCNTFKIVNRTYFMPISSLHCLSGGGSGLITKLCPTLVTLWTVSSLRDSSFHGILLARIVEWAAISFSRGSSWLRNRTRVSCIADRFL